MKSNDTRQDCVNITLVITEQEITGQVVLSQVRWLDDISIRGTTVRPRDTHTITVSPREPCNTTSIIRTIERDYDIEESEIAAKVPEIYISIWNH